MLIYKDKVLPRILPPERESELKEKDIHYTYYKDFLLTFYVQLGPEAVAHATEKTVKEWKASDTELIQICEDNSERELQILSLAGMLEKSEDPSGMMVLTNKDKYYGAGLIVSEKVRQKVNDLFGGESYLIPSSIHEWIIMPKSVISPEEVLIINEEVNSDVVKSDEFLATGVYEIRDGELINAFDMECLL